MRLSSALVVYWRERSYIVEGHYWLDQALQLSHDGQVSPELQAKVFNAAGMLAYYQSDFASASDFLEESLVLNRRLGNVPATALTLSFLGYIAMNRGNYAHARQFYEELQILGEQQHDQVMQGRALANLGTLLGDMGELDQGIAYLQDALAVFKALGSKDRMTVVLNNLGIAVLKKEDYAHAQQYFEEVLALAEEIHSKPLQASGLANLAETYLRIGDYARSRTLHLESLQILQEAGDKLSMAIVLESLACLAVEQGMPEQTALLFGATAAAREQLGAAIAPREQAWYDAAITKAVTALGEATFTRYQANGRQKTLQQAIAYASTSADFTV